ncbi:MAG: YfhO family protein [Lachnospiraceae bacterium]|nr:YfhO family protein [Lachnospiraceae bacterium]
MTEKNLRPKTTLLEKAPFLLSFFLPVIIMIGIFIQRQIFPFGDNSFLRTDMYHQYAPFMNEFMEKLKHGGSLAYSWNIGMGSNFVALYAYYLASPVNWLAVLVPQSLMIEFMTYFIVIKIGLAGLSFCWYLSRHFKTKDLGISFFAVFYALSAYMAAYSWNIMWLDCLVLAPILILGLERLVKEDKCLLYCLTLALSILSNYYISIMICIFMVLYFIALLVMEPDRRRFLKRCANFSIYSLLAGGLAACLLIPVLLALRLTASGDVNIPKTLSSYFSCFEMLARHFVNVEVEIGLDHHPNIYCGTAVLMLLPLYMTNKNISRKEKTMKGVLLFVMLIGFSLNIPNFVWHGFHFPNSLPARQSFLYIILLLTMCYEAYRNLQANTKAQLSGSFWGVVIFIFLCEAIITEETFDFKIYYVTLFFVGLYALLLYYRKSGKAYAPVLAILTVALIAIEASMNTAITSVTTVSRSSYLENQSSFRALAKAIETEDTSLFRIEKEPRKTKNDAALADYHSTSLFSSTANSHLSDLYKTLGLEGNTNAYSFTGATPLSSSLLGVKYTLSVNELDEELYSLIRTDGKVNLYENRFHLPIGFLLPQNMDSLWNRQASNPAAVQNSFASAAAGCYEILVPVPSGSSSIGEYTLNIPETGFYYIDVTNASIKDVTFSDGASTKDFSNVNRGFFLDIGKLEAGAYVTLTTEQEDQNFTAEAYRLDLSQLQLLVDSLKEQPLIVDQYTDTSVTGRITAASDGLLYTSIPYEKGWTLKVDNVETEPVVFADTMLAVPITSGAHSIELSYEPEGLRLGLFISFASVILLALLTLALRLPDRRLKKTVSVPISPDDRTDASETLPEESSPTGTVSPDQSPADTTPKDTRLTDATTPETGNRQKATTNDL